MSRQAPTADANTPTQEDNKMQSTIAEEVLSDGAQEDSEVISNEGILNSAMLNLLLDLLEKQSELMLDGPIAEVAFLEKAASYVGLTRKALETA
ncbi:hypothetical protein ATQ29_22375, partial [Salmonella enterica]|nr:hypothetical protein [Salmonella enterica]